MSLFGGKKKSSVGIDIGTSSIKIAELALGTANKIQLTNYAEYDVGIGPALHSTSVKLSAAEASEILKRIMGEASIVSGIDVAMSVPIFSGFAILISLPVMPDAELEQAVLYEAKKYIPISLSEVQFEWVRVTNSSKGVQGIDATADILIVAVTNELISKYASIAKLSGLTLKYLELDIFSLARSLVTKDLKSALIIDVGSQNTNVTVVQGEWPVTTRNIDVSGAEFSKVLASSLGLDLARAEEIKKKEGVYAGEGILAPLLDSVFMEAKRLMDDYAARSKEEIKKIIVCGGSARLRGITDYAKKVIGKEVVVGSPFHDIIYPRILEETLNDLAPSFGVAVGLALREFKQ